jgi:hypothetical protein
VSIFASVSVPCTHTWLIYPQMAFDNIFDVFVLDIFSFCQMHTWFLTESGALKKGAGRGYRDLFFWGLFFHKNYLFLEDLLIVLYLMAPSPSPSRLFFRISVAKELVTSSKVVAIINLHIINLSVVVDHVYRRVYINFSWD